MAQKLSPAQSVSGMINVPGDKSISHRYAMLTSIAEGESRILNYSTGADCASTLACMQQLGVEHSVVEKEGLKELVVQGVGLHGLREAVDSLDVGNSGSTIRMLSGILAAQPFTTKLAGDESIAKRPMRRVMTPLAQMGARISATHEQFPPLTIQGGALKAIDYSLPVASAQVKSCVLLAGLYADGETIVREPVATRDHTELALQELGADITIEPRVTRIRSGESLKAKKLVVPGDLSSAMFFLAAALAVKEADLSIANVGLNPTRTALLDVLRAMGANIRILKIEQTNGELIGTLRIQSSRLQGALIEGAQTAAIIDEVPALCVLGALSAGGLTVRNAGELRVKETDRIATVADNLQRMGVVAETTEDSIHVPGKQTFHAAELDSFGDHRIAMAFAIAALAADGPSTLNNPEAASVSFPEFYTTLADVAH